MKWLAKLIIRRKPGSQTWELAQIERLASDAKRAKRLHGNSSGFEQRARVIRNGILGGRG